MSCDIPGVIGIDQIRLPIRGFNKSKKIIKLDAKCLPFRQKSYFHPLIITCLFHADLEHNLSPIK